MASLYHYTDCRGARGILHTGLMKSSTGPNHACVYLTSIPPKAGEAHILRNNYDEERVEFRGDDKAEFYFKFHPSSLPSARRLDVSNRDIWVHPGDIDLNSISFECGRTKVSEQAPLG